MSKTYTIIALAAIIFISGCQTANLISKAEPEFISTSGPTGTLNDLDYKPTQAEVDVKIFNEAEIVLAYASSEDQLRSIQSVKITPDCTSQGTIRSCSAKFPDAFDNNGPVFSVGETLFYQWFVEYGEAGGVTESSVGSFTVETASSCPFNAIGAGLGAVECDNTRACVAVTVQLLGTPGLETVPRCIVPNPG